MTSGDQPTHTGPASTRDWVRAWLFIAAIVVVVILLFMAGIGQFWGCGEAYSC